MKPSEQPYSYDQAADEAAVITQKARLLSPEGEIDTATYEEASILVDKLKEMFGSLEAVSNILEIETITDALGITEYFFSKVTESHNLLKNELHGLQAEFIEKIEKAIYENRDPERVSQLLMEFADILARRESGHLLRLLADGDPDLPKKDGFEKIISTFQELTLRQILGALVASGSIEPPPRRSPDPVEPSSYEEVEPGNLKDIYWEGGDSLTFTKDKVFTDNKGRERQFYRATYRFLPKDSEEYVTIDLSTYIGKLVLFEGMEGSMTGASIGPDERKSLGGWATDNYFDQKKPSFVALNQEILEISPEKIGIVFHEMGHCYLYGEPQLQILNKQAEPRGLAWLIQRLRRLDKEKGLTGIKKYQEATESFRQQLESAVKEYGAWLVKSQNQLDNRPKNIIYLSQDEALKYLRRIGVVENRDFGFRGPLISDDEFFAIKEIMDVGNQMQQLKKILNKNQSLTDKEFYMVKTFSADINRLIEIFGERYAGAYAVRQIRSLKPRFVSPLSVLKQQHFNLKARAKKAGDNRFEKGVYRGDKPEMYIS